MKKLAFLLALMLFFSGCGAPVVPAETAAVTEATVETTVPVTEAARPQLTPSPFEPVVHLTPEEQTMLLKLGMAERGKSGCAECVALVMCTVLNRVEAEKFGSSVRSVVLAQDQFTPVADGSYYKTEPNELCYDALEMVIHGWDESQGALYYEWCKGESWHSQNLHLLTQHCDTRFYE